MTDTTQLSLAVIHGIEYFESSPQKQTLFDASAIPIDNLAFANLLDSLANQLAGLIAISDREMEKRFRADPSDYLKSIYSGKEFLLINPEEQLFLVVEPYD